MNQKMALADILVASAVITTEQRDKAIKTAAQAKCLFGEAVVKLGYANEEAIAVALSKQMGIPYASRENKILKVEKGQSLEKVVTEAYAREHLVLPLFLDENVLAVAMAEPDNVLLQDNLRVMCRVEIQPFVATKSQILKAIDEFYQSGTSLIEKTVDESDRAAAAGINTDEVQEIDTSENRLDLDQAISGAKDAAVVSLVNAVLKQAVAERASDIHLESYDERVMLRFRIDGVLYERMAPPKKTFLAVVSRVKILAKMDIAERRLPQDGTFSVKLQNRPIDLRVSICPTVYGEKVVMRILDKGAVELNIDKIGFEPKQKEDFLTAAALPHGLIFLTGPTGSGKTTTLYSVLNTIKTIDMNFMTIEDPVEIKLEGLNQVQVRANIGLTFASALRSFLRQDPDVILVGEVRDQETAQTCLRAALTGHLVLSTLHTNDAMSTVVRLIDLGIEPFLLSSSLALCAAQRLVRVLCPNCKKPYKPSGPELEMCLKESLLGDAAPDPASVTFYQPRGCDKCARTGYIGRKACYEVYRIIPEMQEIIYKYGGDLARLREVAHRNGMWTLRASGWRKVLTGLTTAEEVLSVTTFEG
ncbi:MAG: Flp pilus assembly complex ATPase component TadA [Elusimicrobia bacterium]|nr:Flp pilus assembly complex ATPase component TadA [Elusimicrobiota bacterium]